MSRPSTRQPSRKTYRTRTPSIDPYFLEDTAFTLSDIRRARADSEAPASR